MKNPNKIRVSERNIIKTLDVLSCYELARCGRIIIDNNLYRELSFMKREQAKQTLNAMMSRDIIDIYGYGNSLEGKIIYLNPNAFVYKLDHKYRIFRFWCPIVISIISLICSLRNEIHCLFKLLFKL